MALRAAIYHPPRPSLHRAISNGFAIPPPFSAASPLVATCLMPPFSWRATLPGPPSALGPWACPQGRRVTRA
eukprot:5562118-Pyramimonas_sp.AAC.1